MKTLQEPMDWSRYETACIAASVHLGRHEREMADFVWRHRDAFEGLSAAFLSVTLSEAGALAYSRYNPIVRFLSSDRRYFQTASMASKRVVPTFVIVWISGPVCQSKSPAFMVIRLAGRPGSSTLTRPSCPAIRIPDFASV